MQTKKKIFFIDSNMSYKTFELLQNELVKDSGPTPLNSNKILWSLMKEKKILCWFEKFGDMKIGFKLPKNCDIQILSDGTKKNCVAYKNI